MSEVERFMRAERDMTASLDGGQWVRYSDYEKLEAERDDREHHRGQETARAEAEHDRANHHLEKQIDLERRLAEARKQRDEELRERLQPLLDELRDEIDSDRSQPFLLLDRLDSIFEEADGG